MRWTDGDSFTFLAGRFEGSGVRMQGFNTLESFGPVHRWGDWTPEDLYEVAGKAKELVSSRTWVCSTEGRRDAYKRVLVSCPDAAAALVRQGLAHVFAFREAADEGLMALQREAREEGRGMWAKGRPEWLVTAVHSKEGGTGSMSVVSTRTGQWSSQPVPDAFESCQEVCYEHPVRGSCMLFVPWQNRYRDRAPCLGPAPGH